MRPLSELSREEMIEIISEIQVHLWWNCDAPEGKWDANKEWDSETLDNVAAVLEERELCPRESPGDKPVIAYRHR
jgi:hypothetical protein